SILSRQRNSRVLMGEVTGFDLDARKVLLRDDPRIDGLPTELPYDSLILAAGARHHYFNHPEWEQFAPGLKTVEDATEMRRRILSAFEAAERTSDEATRRAYLTFVIVGAGPTGVELAGAVADVAHTTLRRDFR